MNLENKNILVCGMARSGKASALLAKKNKANVTLQDFKTEDNLKEELTQLKNKGIKFYLGKNPDDILDDKDIIILSPGIPTDLSFIKKAKEKNIPIWGETELAFRFCKGQVLAITGTNGKTTVASLVGEIVQRVEENSKVVGNIGIPFAEEVESLSENDFAVVEMSSFQLESIVTFKPKVAAILNITPDHLSRHKTFENYVEAKKRVFENQTNENFLVLNYDDEICRNMASSAKSKIIFFSRKVYLEEGVFLKDDFITSKMFGKEEKIFDIRELKILGNHNIENAMTATAISLAINVPKNIIASSLREFKAVEHRTEFVSETKGISFYNDSKATNPDSAIKSLEAIDQPIILIGGGSNKGSSYDEWVKLFPSKVKFLFLIGEVSDIIAETCEKFSYKYYEKIKSLEEAVTKAYEKAENGDCILLSPACASYDMFDNFEHRGTVFKELVRNLT